SSTIDDGGPTLEEVPVSVPPPSFDAPLTLGAQIDARAAHPDVGGRVFLRQHDRTWTFRRYRDECVRLAHLLRRRLRPIDDQPPGPVATGLENPLELLALPGAGAYGVPPLVLRHPRLPR